MLSWSAVIACPRIPLGHVRTLSVFVPVPLSRLPCCLVACVHAVRPYQQSGPVSTALVVVPRQHSIYSPAHKPSRLECIPPYQGGSIGVAFPVACSSLDKRYSNLFACFVAVSVCTLKISKRSVLPYFLAQTAPRSSLLFRFHADMNLVIPHTKHSSFSFPRH